MCERVPRALDGGIGLIAVGLWGGAGGMAVFVLPRLIAVRQVLLGVLRALGMVGAGMMMSDWLLYQPEAISNACFTFRSVVELSMDQRSCSAAGTYSATNTL